METDRTASTPKAVIYHAARAMAPLAGMVAAIVAVAICMPAQAVMVGVTPNVVPNTSVNPASYGPTWTQGDPGWNNAAHLTFANGVYLGDGWILTAWHVGTPNLSFEPGPSFQPIPNQNFTIANNPALAPEGLGPSLTQPNADLRLIRINGDPGLPSVTIASQPLAQGSEVVDMGFGYLRAAAQKSFTVNNGTNPPTWSEVPSCSGSNCHHGYFPDNVGKRWGTNHVANADQVLNGSSGKLRTVVSDGTIAYLTTYDQFSSNPFEFQVVAGDSGSGVFHKRNGQWELAGIVLANYTFSGQSTETFNSGNGLAVFGNASAFADLSSYRTQILDVINANQDYSLVGDLNLDGAAGGAADLAAFIAGWRYNNGTGLGTITSWKMGDVTHDGKTDLADFLRFRSGLNVAAGAELTELMTSYVSAGVPEPSTAMLNLGPAILFALRARRRRLAP